MDRKKYTDDELKELLKRAYSYESREGHRKEELETWLAGTVPGEGRLWDIYVDKEDNSWYKVRIVTGYGIVSEYEAVFGHPEQQKRRKKKVKLSRV